VCQQLKSDPELKDIPIIFLSALTDTKDKVKGLDLGGGLYLQAFSTGRGDRPGQHHLTISSLKRDLQRKPRAAERQRHL